MPTRRTQTSVVDAPGSPGRSSATDRLRAALSAEDWARAADAAMELGPAARDRLPEPLRPAFDSVCDAFALYEIGQDDPAREKLQSVGLTSPFLDWKLVFRGLIAFTGGDDARAIDNWSRLAADRLAARLIAPLRFALDPTFRAAQAPPAQATLLRRGDRLIGGPAGQLRAIQALLARGRMADALRQAEAVLPELKRLVPAAARQLEECFGTAIVAGGGSADIRCYRQIFGTPADDPALARLEALAAEERQNWSAAHKAWQQFEQSMIDNPAWPAVDRDRARAMVWCRMGRNADDAARRGRRLQPTAETCFKRASQLAPDLLEPYEQTFLMLRERNQVGPAIAAGKRLLKRFPDHDGALEAMAEMCRDRGDVAATLEYAQRAVAVNPLDAHLRDLLADGLRSRARARAALGSLADAANDLAEVLRLGAGRSSVGVLAQAAAVAFKSGDVDAAEERLRAAWAIAPAAAAYAMAVEAVRFNLQKTLKQRFENEFAAALAAAPAGPAAVALADCFFDHVRQGNYAGFKGHEKKIQTYIERAISADVSERNLVDLCRRFEKLDWMRLLKKAAVFGQKRFPRSPFFFFYEAVGHLDERRVLGAALWKIEPLVEKARRLAEAAPPDEKVRDLLRELNRMQQLFGGPVSVARMMDELFNSFAEE